jgi:hypothetical protein
MTLFQLRACFGKRIGGNSALPERFESPLQLPPPPDAGKTENVSPHDRSLQKMLNGFASLSIFLSQYLNKLIYEAAAPVNPHPASRPKQSNERCTIVKQQDPVFGKIV